MQRGFFAYRTFVVLYAALLPVYFFYRFVHSILPPTTSFTAVYQWITCVLELYGALNVLILGFIRFLKPWAEAAPQPPMLPVDGDGEQLLGPFDVAILVPCYSEPDDVIFGTIAAALVLQDPLASRVRVVLCDDGGRPALRQRLEELELPERTLYVSRPNIPNVPRHGKAGNLNHALRSVLYPGGGPPPDNAVIVVFDCDMEAHGDFLSHTLPYLACDKCTALVQTPQHFYNVVPSADIFNHHNLTFYQAMQPGLDAWGATVCCGTNFVARASALHSVDYFPTESITEDYLLSLKLATAGWRVRFHAAVVSTGEAPEDLKQVFKQRNRWCCGCFQVFLHPSLPTWLVGLFRRSPVKAICWLNAPFSYLGTLLTVPLWAIVPALSLYAEIHPVRALSPAFVFLWLAYFSLLVLVVEMMPSRLNRRSAAFLGSKCNAIFWYCFACALGSAIRGRITPSKAKEFEVTEKRGFSADAELRRAAPSPDVVLNIAEKPHLISKRGLRASAEDTAEPLIEVSQSLCGGPELLSGSSRTINNTAATDGHMAEGGQTVPEAQAHAQEPATTARNCNSLEAGHGGSSSSSLAPSALTVSTHEEVAAPSRDSSQSDVIFHQLVLSTELLFFVAGLLHRAFGPMAHASAFQSERGHGKWSDFHTWQQLGLVLVPAAWLLLNSIPHGMALAYAYLPHAHRVQSAAVKYALRAQSGMLFFVSLAMVQSAAMHWLSHHHSLMHHGYDHAQSGGIGAGSNDEGEMAVSSYAYGSA